MNIESCEEPCSVALKEWGATVQALREGRQILLLRKGGIHDAGGVFALEHPRFWLLPTAFHQAKPMLKPEHRDLLEAPVSNRDELKLQVLAEVAASWSVGVEQLGALSRGHHIWNEDYVQLRLGYQPEHPLGVLALRVYEVPEPHVVAGEKRFWGCRSWIELSAALSAEGARAAVGGEEFGEQLGHWREALG